MSKMNFKNVNVVRKNRKNVRISSDCCQRKDGAVEGIQEAGKDLGHLFCMLRDPKVAAALVRAIRCRNKKIIDDLIGPHCHVVCFFHQGRLSCVRISCVFGDCCDVRITFDICVSPGQCTNL